MCTFGVFVDGAVIHLHDNEFTLFLELSYLSPRFLRLQHSELVFVFNMNVCQLAAAD